MQIPLLSLTLSSVFVVELFARDPQFMNLQPGTFPPPRFPQNYSSGAPYWSKYATSPQQTDDIRTNNEFTHIQSRAVSHGPHWNGWGGIKHIFSFGDSYMSTGFDTYAAQPNADNPMGNPPYPGATAANGPNFMDFLTTTYNMSMVLTYNFGFGGAMIDNAIVPSPFGLQIMSFLDQLTQLFQPKYSANPQISWAKEDTLFLVFIGINDAINTFTKFKSDALQYAQIKRYEDLVNKLYTLGARNFVFMHIPPIDRAPYVLPFSQSQRQDLANWIGRYMFRLRGVIWNFTRRYPEATVFEFDTNLIFRQVLANATQFPETASYTVMDTFCDVYQRGTPELSTFDPSCQVPVDRYFWLNTLHPTYPMHNFIASRIARLLQT